MRPLHSCLITILMVCAFSIGADAQVLIQPSAETFEKPRPEFPQSEYGDGVEGWVLVGLDVGRSGLVTDIYVMESSGSEAFENSAVATLQHWRFTPGEEGTRTVLVNFEYNETVVQLSRRFMSLNARVHRHIDKDRLDEAEEVLADIRSDDDLTVFELAYSYLSEGRIAGKRGDHARQLALFRKAVRNDGRWLARDNYLATLRAIVILEVDQQDYSSAVRDYDLMVESPVGREMSADLAEVIEVIRDQMEEHNFGWQPYAAADNQVTVERERPNLDNSLSQPPVNPRGNVQPSPPPSRPPGRN
jgi:TonB family protein